MCAFFFYNMCRVDIGSTRLRHGHRAVSLSVAHFTGVFFFFEGIGTGRRVIHTRDKEHTLGVVLGIINADFFSQSFSSVRCYAYLILPCSMKLLMSLLAVLFPNGMI